MSALAFTEVWALASELALSVCEAVYLELALRIRALGVSACNSLDQQLQTTLDKSLGIGSPDEQTRWRAAGN